jgi:hypothetical protein
MNVVRLPHSVRTDAYGAEENEAVLRDLETIIRETLPPDRAEAYIESLRRLLGELGYQLPRTPDDPSDRSGCHGWGRGTSRGTAEIVGGEPVAAMLSFLPHRRGPAPSSCPPEKQ